MKYGTKKLILLADIPKESKRVPERRIYVDGVPNFVHRQCLYNVLLVKAT